MCCIRKYEAMAKSKNQTLFKHAEELVNASTFYFSVANLGQFSGVLTCLCFKSI